MKCYHYDNCGNESAYELDTVDGKTIRVCKECDEMYSSCRVCGKSGIWDAGYGDMSLVNGDCDEPTCFYCLEKLKCEACGSTNCFEEVDTYYYCDCTGTDNIPHGYSLDELCEGCPHDCGEGEPVERADGECEYTTYEGGYKCTKCGTYYDVDSMSKLRGYLQLS